MGNLIKILCIRINLVAAVGLLAACGSSAPSKYATEDEGPITVRARNNLASENPAGLVEVGRGFERAGNYSGALSMYGQAMAAAPDLVEAKLAFARVSIRIGKTKAGMMLLTELLDKFPQRADVRTELTQAYITQGDFEAASLFFAPVLKAERVTPGNLILGGKMAAVAGKTTEARSLFERALSATPNNPPVLEHLALSFALQGEFAAAVGIVQRSMDEPAGLISGKIALANVYALSGQLQAAMQLARGAMTTDEATKRLMFYQLLPRLNRREQAEAIYFNRIPVDALERLSGTASK